MDMLAESLVRLLSAIVMAYGIYRYALTGHLAWLLLIPLGLAAALASEPLGAAIGGLVNG
jgi:hypothetical protein